MGRSYTDRDLKLLFGKSGMFCAFPACRRRLLAPGTDVDDEAILGHIAHVVAHADTGPRADTAFPQPSVITTRTSSCFAGTTTVWLTRRTAHTRSSRCAGGSPTWRLGSRRDSPRA